jgi:hypothetical protein
MKSQELARDSCEQASNHMVAAFPLEGGVCWFAVEQGSTLAVPSRRQQCWEKHGSTMQQQSTVLYAQTSTVASNRKIDKEVLDLEDGDAALAWQENGMAPAWFCCQRVTMPRFLRRRSSACSSIPATMRYLP